MQFVDVAILIRADRILRLRLSALVGSSICSAKHPTNRSTLLAWDIAAFTHRGRVRATNEDTVAIDQRILTGDMTEPFVTSSAADRCVLMIADGMGGHAHGAMASRAVLDYLTATLDRLSDSASCADAIENANRHLYTLMQHHDEAYGMGTTLVGAVLTPDRLLTFNVGDSRCYLFSSGRLVQLSHDDVLDNASRHSNRRRSHVLTQALGGSLIPDDVAPHIATEPPLKSDETLLLCSDGLTDMVSDRNIDDIFRRTQTPLHAVRKLAAKAYRAGARDNVSLIAVGAV